MEVVGDDVPGNPLARERVVLPSVQQRRLCARCKDDDRNFTRDAFLVVRIVGVFGGDDRPETLAFLRACLPCGDGYDLRPNLDLCSWVRLQVQPPHGMIGLSPIGGNHDEVVSLGQVKQRRYALLALLRPMVVRSKIGLPPIFRPTAPPVRR